MMTLAEAKQILATYKMPLSPEQMAKYRQALDLVTKSIWGGG